MHVKPDLVWLILLAALCILVQLPSPALAGLWRLRGEFVSPDTNKHWPAPVVTAMTLLIVFLLLKGLGSFGSIPNNSKVALVYGRICQGRWQHGFCWSPPRVLHHSCPAAPYSACDASPRGILLSCSSPHAFKSQHTPESEATSRLEVGIYTCMSTTSHTLMRTHNKE